MRVGIVGSTGYTGADLVRMLLRHPEVKITALTSETYADLAYARVYPALTGLLEGSCERLDPERLADHCDVLFTALPHRKAMECVPSFLRHDRRVIDLSADFRLQDPQVYEAWYARHEIPELLAQAVYGLPELYRDQIRMTKLVANPGCYPTSAILGVAPLAKNRLINLESIIISAASGVTGAGRSPSVETLFCEVNEGMKAYKVGEHRHTPEMEQEIGLLAGEPVRLTFTPHLVPLNRGILTTIYSDLIGEETETEIRDAYHDLYSGEAFVRVLPAGMYPNVRDVRGTNYCDIGLKLDQRTGRVIVVAAIDNLVKGAAGQAVQNFNLMLGFSETTGLEGLPWFV